MRTAPLVLAIVLVALVPPAQAANFGSHAGLADDVWSDPHFRAGALLADVDHWLSPAEPRTDTLAFALGIAQRAWTGSRNAWRFATGWYEHLDQDARFAESEVRILAVYSSYTDTDVRLAFDFLTLQKHPFPADFDWVLADGEALALIQGGLTATDGAGVRQAVDDLLHSQNYSLPGLSLQLDAARAYGLFYPDRVANMQAEYDAYYARVTAGYYPILPRLDLELRTILSIVMRNAASPGAVLPSLKNAMALEAMRPAGWMALEVDALEAFVDALPAAGLRPSIWMILSERASRIAEYLD
ncbi:MAG TPA: hypothetical protein VGR51_01390 [Thermoplasmata archaeon]|nr:hypothetical protein [Thermoplasmata archaeon]